ncbi:MAG: hypothetical protein ACRDYC_04185, partial [Acidimicrobiales bacterium]
ALTRTHSPSRVQRPTRLATASCPPVDRGCRPISRQGGVLVEGSVRYGLGTARDVVVLGRWTCGPLSYPALLQPADGRVWVFSSWASLGHPAVGRLVAGASGARSLAVVAGRGSCDSLEAVGPGARVTVVYPVGGRR